VLAGPNGSGKTAVLEAALIASGGHKLVVVSLGPKAVRKGNKSYEITAEFRSGTDSVTTKSTAQHNPQSPPLGVPHWYFSSWRAPQPIGPVDVTVGKRGRRPKKNDENRLRNVKQQLVNAAAKAHFRPGQRSLLSQYTDWMNSINQAWSRFQPDAGGEFLVDLAESESEDDGAFDVFRSHKDGTRLEVDCLSSGQLELLLFLAALVLNNDREGLVFIDEPELHLDPQWHRLIVRSLVELQPRAQFLVATHSPEIYDEARSYERHFLVAEDDPRARIWRSVKPVGAGA
jgi:DNA repair exonuclease SbcCD ATPase subunit